MIKGKKIILILSLLLVFACSKRDLIFWGLSFLDEGTVAGSGGSECFEISNFCFYDMKNGTYDFSIVDITGELTCSCTWNQDGV